MNDRPRWDILGISVERWARRWSLHAFTHPCIDCGAPRTTSIPFVQGTLRGLRAPTCTCGNGQGPFCLVRDPAHGDLFTGSDRVKPWRSASGRSRGRKAER